MVKCSRSAHSEPRLDGAVHVVAVQGDVAHAVHRLRTRHPAEPARRLAHDDLHADWRRLYAMRCELSLSTLYPHPPSTSKEGLFIRECTVEDVYEVQCRNLSMNPSSISLVYSNIFDSAMSNTAHINWAQFIYHRLCAIRGARCSRHPVGRYFATHVPREGMLRIPILYCTLPVLYTCLTNSQRVWAQLLYCCFVVSVAECVL